MLNGVGAFSGIAPKRSQCLLLCGGNLIGAYDSQGAFFRIGCSVLTSTFPKDQQVRQGIPAEPVRAMESCAAFSCRKQAGDIRHLRIRIHPNPAHHVVRGWPDFHGFDRDINIRELFELVIHTRKLLLDVLGSVRNTVLNPRDVQKHPTMWTATTFAYLATNTASHVIPRQEFWRSSSVFVALRVAPSFLFRVRGLICVGWGDIVKHETPAILVPQYTSFASDPFGDQDAANTGTPEHARRQCTPSCCW